MKVASRRELATVVRHVLEALERAPHKHRVDLQAYWDWFDGPRAEAVVSAEAVLTDLERAES